MDLLTAGVWWFEMRIPFDSPPGSFRAPAGMTLSLFSAISKAEEYVDTA
jgi:hypothetical protein